MSLKETNEGYTRGFGKRKGKLIFNLKKKTEANSNIMYSGMGKFYYVGT